MASQPDKVLSLFEPHTEGFAMGQSRNRPSSANSSRFKRPSTRSITAFDVHHQRPADRTLWAPALDRHRQIFDRPPDLAAGDRGFSSARNEQAALDRGLRRVVLPTQGRKSPARRAHERQRWFRRDQRWRTGCEGRISVRKRRHGL
jgi:IS5 family transposase